MQTPAQNAIVPTALISQKILFVRGTRVMLDVDLATNFMFRVSSEAIIPSGEVEEGVAKCLA